MKSEFFVEYQGLTFNEKEITDKAKEIWKNQGNRVKDLKELDLYLKPEEKRCYYVFNKKETENNYFEI